MWLSITTCWSECVFLMNSCFLVEKRRSLQFGSIIGFVFIHCPFGLLNTSVPFLIYTMRESNTCFLLF